jgi:hypothetical protein
VDGKNSFADEEWARWSLPQLNAGAMRGKSSGALRQLAKIKLYKRGPKTIKASFFAQLSTK